MFMTNPRLRCRVVLGGFLGLLTCVSAWPARAIDGNPQVLAFDTEILSMDLTGQAYLPLARDPGPPTGYEMILTEIKLAESATLSSVGHTTAVPLQGPVGPYQVNGFFDVFFDVTLTDIDPNRDFAGGIPYSFLGAAMHLQMDPLIVQADPSQPFWGVVPPVGALYRGLTSPFPVGDINGNGEYDVLKFTSAELSVGLVTGSYGLSDGSWMQSFDVSGNFAGSVQDISTDPPFGFGLTGPTTGRSQLGGAVVPEPSTWVLFGAGVVLLPLLRRRKRA